MITNVSCPGPRENLTIKLLRYRKYGPGRFFHGLVPNPFRVGCPTPRQVMLHPALLAARYACPRAAHVASVLEQPVPPARAIEATTNSIAGLTTKWPEDAEALAWSDAFERASTNNSRDLSLSSPNRANSRAPSADGIGRLIDVLA